jgi:hypothetical protein
MMMIMMRSDQINSNEVGVHVSIIEVARKSIQT